MRVIKTLIFELDMNFQIFEGEHCPRNRRAKEIDQTLMNDI